MNVQSPVIGEAIDILKLGDEVIHSHAPRFEIVQLLDCPLPVIGGIAEGSEPVADIRLGIPDHNTADRLRMNLAFAAAYPVGITAEAVVYAAFDGIHRVCLQTIRDTLPLVS